MGENAFTKKQDIQFSRKFQIIRFSCLRGLGAEQKKEKVRNLKKAIGEAASGRGFKSRKPGV